MSLGARLWLIYDGGLREQARARNNYKCRDRVGRKQRGTTLIEVMVALAIISMMMVTVWTAFRNTVHAIEQSETQQLRERTIRNAMHRMCIELSMAYLSFNRPRFETRHFTYFEGREAFGSDSVTFSALAHLRVRKDANESDQSMIQYFVADDPTELGQRNLYRRETRRLTGDLPEVLERFAPAWVMLENVVSIDFKYWDQRTLEWREEWATIRNDAQPDRLPERVRIELVVMDDDGGEVRYQAQTVLFMQEKIDLAR